MAVTNAVKAQVITTDSEEKKSTTTFQNVNPEAQDADVAECLNLYAGLMENVATEMRVVETRVLSV